MSKKLKNNLSTLLKGKKGDDLVFSIEGKNDKLKILTYDSFRKYLEISGYPAGIHKIRRVRGTNLMLDLLKQHKFKPSSKSNKLLRRKQKEAEEFIINKILIPIAKLLGHKSGTGKDLWTTTAKSYIDPVPLIKWFEHHELRMPKWLPKAAGAD